jgi:integrase
MTGKQRQDLDLDAGTVTIARQLEEVHNVPAEGPPKTGRPRTVHLPAPAIDALRVHRDRQGPGLPIARVFRRSNGSDLRRGNVY